MIRLSIPFRQALAKLTLPLLIAAAAGLTLLARADARLEARARMAFADALTPLFAAAGTPVAELRGLVREAGMAFDLHDENLRLAAENERLRHWQKAALALHAENARLRAMLNYVPDPTPSFVTVPVAADAGGIYARAVLVSAGLNQGISKGGIALDGQGVAGRVTEVGARSARVLLLTDINSRIPVSLGDNRARAVLVGTNGPRPRLMYWPEGAGPAEGERVTTSAEAGAFPAGLPVGVVRHGKAGVAEVELAAQLDRLDVLRIFDYGLQPMPPDGADRPARARNVAERRR